MGRKLPFFERIEDDDPYMVGWESWERRGESPIWDRYRMVYLEVHEDMGRLDPHVGGVIPVENK